MIALKNLAFQFFINIDDSEKKNIVKQIQVFVLVFDTLIMGKKWMNSIGTVSTGFGIVYTCRGMGGGPKNSTSSLQSC